MISRQVLLYALVRAVRFLTWPSLYNMTKYLESHSVGLRGQNRFFQEILVLTVAVELNEYPSHTTPNLDGESIPIKRAESVRATKSNCSSIQAHLELTT